MISWFICFLFFILLVITGAHRLLVIVRNGQRSRKKNSYMNPRLSGYISVLSLVFYAPKCLFWELRDNGVMKNLQFLSVC